MERIEQVQHVFVNGKKRTIFSLYRFNVFCGKQSIKGWYKKERTILKHWHES
jgi:hypothetical protein